MPRHGARGTWSNSDDEEDDALIDDAELGSDAVLQDTKRSNDGDEGGARAEDNGTAAAAAAAYPRKHRLQATATYCLAMVGLGLTMSALGPTIPTLAVRFGLSGGTALAPLLIMRGVGYTVGTLGAGRLSSRHPAQRHKMLTGTAVGMGAAAMFVPVFPGLASLYIFTLLFSLFGGALDLGANVMLVEVWSGNSGGASAMNVLHFSWGVGSLLSPLVAEGVGLTPSRLPATWATIGAMSAVLGVPMWFVPAPVPHAADGAGSGGGGGGGGGGAGGSGGDGDGDENGHAAESNGGAAAASESKSSNATDGENGGQPAEGAPMPPFVFGAAIAALCIFYAAYAGAEHSMGDWLATFAISRLKKSEDDGADLTSVYWGCLTGGRLIGALTTALVTPAQLIAGDFVCATIGCVLLATWGTVSLGGSFVGAAMIGLGLSTLYPMGIMLAERKLKLTGGWISVFISGGTIGSVVLPLVVGLLMAFDDDAMTYAVAVFVAALLACYRFVQRYPDLPRADAGHGGHGGGHTHEGVGVGWLEATPHEDHDGFDDDAEMLVLPALRDGASEA